MMRTSLIILLIMFLTPPLKAQNVGVKTNLLYGAATLTPNLGVEIGLGRRLTFDIAGGYNWFNLDGSVNNNKKLVHWIVQPELRYFFCEKFNGHFLGGHGLISQYNIGGHDLPFFFGDVSNDFRHEGRAFGAGISYGYQFVLGWRWNLEASVGAGYIYMNYDKYNCVKCGNKVESNKHQNYLGPTKASLSIIYTF